MTKLTRFLVLLFAGMVLWGGILACAQSNEDILPTPVATAFLPTPVVTKPLNTPLPTKVFPTATVLPTDTPVIPPTAAFGDAAAINITSPSDSAILPTGTTIQVSGLGQVAPDHTLTVQLVSISGFLLAETVASLENNIFQATLTVPITMTGAAQIQVQVQTMAGERVAVDALPVTLIPNAAANPRYLELYRPAQQSKAVGGYYLFFDGFAAQPTGTVQIAIYVDDCQTEAAATSFRVSSSSYWQGYIYIPNDLSGPGCAIARFGTPGTENWREAQVPINLQKPTEEDAFAVYLFSPLHQSELVGGTNASFWGTAYNAADDLVVITVLREDGVSLAQGSARVDTFGYWETTVNIPLTYTGPAQVVVAIGNLEEGNVAQSVITVTILPPPTPTPGSGG